MPSQRLDSSRNPSSVTERLADWFRRLRASGRDAAALRQSQGNYQALFDSIPMAALVYQIKSRQIVDANPAMAGLLGLPLERLRGSSLDAFLPPQDIADFIEGLRNRDLTKIHRGRRRVRAFDGRELDIVVHSFRLEPLDLERRLVLLEDVTQVSRLQGHLAANEQRFRSLVENASEALVLLNPDGRVAYASPSVTNVTGFTPEERLGAHASQILHPEDQTPAWEIFDRCLREPGAVHAFQARVRHKDGRWIHAAGKLRNLLDDPAVGALVLNYRDVTAEHEAAEALKRSEALFRTLVEQSHETTLLIGPSMDILYVTPNAVAFTGYGPTERLGQVVGVMTHPDDLDRVRSEFAELLKRPGDSVRLEYRLRHKDGHWVSVEAFASNRLGDPAIGALVVTCRDVSEAREAQRRLMRLERLAAVGQTAAGLAHEIRNPLAVIVGRAEILRDQLGDSARADLDAILRQSDRLRDLVREVLERAKDRELTLARESAVDLFERSLRAARQRFGMAGEGVEVVRDYASPAPELMADAAQMERVLTNLILNALQSMRGRGVLTLSCRGGAEGVLLEVADSGGGIPPADLPRVFEPFFTTKETGSGLGLWLCRGIVEEHGGRLEAENRAPRGCVFRVQLPPPAGAP